MTQAKLGYGTLLQIGDGASPEVFTTVAEVTDIGAIGETADLVDVTSHDSPNKRKEFILALAEGDEISVTANFIANNTSQEVIRSFFAGAQKNIKVTLPDADETIEFAAVCTHHDVTPLLEEQMALNFTLKITGELTYTP